ncbi:MAG TPA: hypothetical protein DD381_06965 [Lentisphaeria bacterium]|nr:MAG: hypothetical protein A2X47_10945 [Lentisphaerae bacterium GWF2_38_69]HBM16064.1 hypothetical protein [Lentisphaeria bacterium]
MKSKSYLDQVIYVSQDGTKIDNFIVSADTIIESRNLVKDLMKTLDSQTKKCESCLAIECRLSELDRQLNKLNQQPKLAYHKAEGEL